MITRVLRLTQENPGDAKSVGGGIVEMRISFGPGYRVYYTHRGNRIVVLLCGGDKSSQHEDVRQAKQIAEDLAEGDFEQWESK